MEINNIAELFASNLSGIYDAERTLYKILPGMANAAGNEALAEVLRQHGGETEWQMKRLDRISEILGITFTPGPNEAMQGLVAETREFIDSIDDRKVRDVALLASARKIKHYEMAAYSSLSLLAQELGHTQIGEILNQSFGEEEKTDEALCVLAREGIYGEALREAA